MDINMDILLSDPYPIRFQPYNHHLYIKGIKENISHFFCTDREQECGCPLFQCLVNFTNNTIMKLHFTSATFICLSSSASTSFASSIIPTWTILFLSSLHFNHYIRTIQRMVFRQPWVCPDGLYKVHDSRMCQPMTKST